MNDRLNTELVKKILDGSLDDLDHSTLARLRDMHLMAMNHIQSRNKQVELLAWGRGNATLHFPSLRYRTFRWTGTLILAASILIGIACWQQAADDDNNDADISILTGDLPIQYYAD